jgi:hypothetical protein
MIGTSLAPQHFHACDIGNREHPASSNIRVNNARSNFSNRGMIVSDIIPIFHHFFVKKTGQLLIRPLYSFGLRATKDNWMPSQSVVMIAQ